MAGLVRVWKASGSAEGIERYCEHFASRVLPQLQAIEGFVEASVLVDTSAQVVVATVWESLDAVKAFAGENYEHAVVEPIVHELLEGFDDEVRHFTIAARYPSTAERSGT
jgi:heme-degrading monooxygenase HmoA